CYGGPGIDDNDTQYCPATHSYIPSNAICDAVDSGFDKPDVSVGDAAVTIDSGPDAGSITDAATDASMDASDGDGG
ncbi:MAG: hypothetical protein ABI461_23265, partial [Polyangiaceae bacterium]